MKGTSKSNVKKGMGTECKQRLGDNALLSLLAQNRENSWSISTLKGNWDDHVAKDTERRERCSNAAVLQMKIENPIVL